MNWRNAALFSTGFDSENMLLPPGIDGEKIGKIIDIGVGCFIQEMEDTLENVAYSRVEILKLLREAAK